MPDKIEQLQDAVNKLTPESREAIRDIMRNALKRSSWIYPLTDGKSCRIDITGGELSVKDLEMLAEYLEIQLKGCSKQHMCRPSQTEQVFECMDAPHPVYIKTLTQAEGLHSNSRKECL